MKGEGGAHTQLPAFAAPEKLVQFDNHKFFSTKWNTARHAEGEKWDTKERSKDITKHILIVGTRKNGKAAHH